MKHYLWLGIATIFMGAHASDNPFELKSNFGQLDQEQEVLLGDLKKIADEKELAEDAMDEMPAEVAVEKDTESVIEIKPTEEVSNALTAVVEEVAPEEASNELEKVKEPVQTLTEAEKESVERLNTMRAAALAASRVEAAKKEAAKEVKKVKEVKEVKEVKIEKAVVNNVPTNDNPAQKAKLLEEVKKKELELAAAKKEAAQKEAAKKEAEKKEVEAYEKQRAEKLAKQVEAEALEREAMAQKAKKAKQIEAEKQAALMKEKKLKDAVVKAKPVKAAVPKATKKTPPATAKINDIDVEKEQREAKEAADKAYEEAVKEMSQED